MARKRVRLITSHNGQFAVIQSQSVPELGTSSMYRLPEYRLIPTQNLYQTSRVNPISIDSHASNEPISCGIEPQTGFDDKDLFQDAAWESKFNMTLGSLLSGFEDHDFALG